jgi:hypothetical protein
MRTHFFSGVLTAATGLLSFHAQAAALTPTIEFEEGPLAAAPVTSGNVSGAGLTATGAPLIVTEFNLTSLGALDSFAAAISGSLAASGGLSWAAYVDPGNTPFGTTDLIASYNFTDPSGNLSLGFTGGGGNAGTLAGPFALTEVLTFSGPAGDAFTFNTSITATSNAVPEPAPLAGLGTGLLGLGLIVIRRRGCGAAVTGPIEHY